MKKNYTKEVSVILIIILFAISILAFKSYKLEAKKRILKSNLIELSDIKYGMFNVDKWKENISVIVGKKIKELKLEGENRTNARKKIITFLYTVINEYEKNYKTENKRKSFFGLSFKNSVADFLSVFDKFRNNIPNIADQILNFLDKKENKDRIKDYILLQLDNYTDNTFQKIDYSTYNNILNKYYSDTENQCKLTIQNKINTIEQKIKKTNYFFIALFLLLLMIIIYNKSNSKLTIILYVLIAFHFLILGLLLPMIDIDARIGSMEFKLLNETISFKDQVLYFKSKSILEMAKIMLINKQLKIILVGVLVLVFSLLFPFAKLISTILVLFKENMIKNKVINFIVFKSGKWSMADVMVVAIFMSYIGFSGIISNQLSQLEKITDKLNIITTNNSELQSGFFFFAGFVIISISVSQIIINRYEREKPAENNV